MNRNILRLLVLLFLIFNLTNSYSQKSKHNYLLSFIDSTSGEELYGYKNTKSDIVIPAKFNFTYTDTMYNFALVALNYNWIGINRKDSVVLIPYIFDNGPDYVEEGLFRFVENNKIGLANLRGEKVIPAQYDYAEPFFDGMAAINVGGHIEGSGCCEQWTGGVWGFINKKGKVVIKPIFLEAYYFEHGKSEVTTQDGKRVIINKKGKIIKKLKTMKLKKAPFLIKE